MSRSAKKAAPAGLESFVHLSAQRGTDRRSVVAGL